MAPQQIAVMAQRAVPGAERRHAVGGTRGDVLGDRAVVAIPPRAVRGRLASGRGTGVRKEPPDPHLGAVAAGGLDQAQVDLQGAPAQHQAIVVHGANARKLFRPEAFPQGPVVGNNRQIIRWRPEPAQVFADFGRQPLQVETLLGIQQAQPLHDRFQFFQVPDGPRHGRLGGQQRAIWIVPDGIRGLDFGVDCFLTCPVVLGAFGRVCVEYGGDGLAARGIKPPPDPLRKPWPIDRAKNAADPANLGVAPGSHEAGGPRRNPAGTLDERDDFPPFAPGSGAHRGQQRDQAALGRIAVGLGVRVQGEGGFRRRPQKNGRSERIGRKQGMSH